MSPTPRRPPSLPALPEGPAGGGYPQWRPTEHGTPGTEPHEPILHIIVEDIEGSQPFNLALAYLLRHRRVWTMSGQPLMLDEGRRVIFGPRPIIVPADTPVARSNARKARHSSPVEELKRQLEEQPNDDSTQVVSPIISYPLILTGIGETQYGNANSRPPRGPHENHRRRPSDQSVQQEPSSGLRNTYQRLVDEQRRRRPSEESGHQEAATGVQKAYQQLTGRASADESSDHPTPPRKLQRPRDDDTL